MTNKVGKRSGEVLHSSLEAIKRQPIPVMVLGLGLGWILAGSMRSRTVTPYGLERMYPIEPGTDGALPEELYQSGLENPGGRDYREGGELAAGSRFHNVFTSSKEKASTIRHKATKIAERMRTGTSHTNGNFRAQMKQKRGNLTQLYEENPMAVAAALFALGTLIGLVTPETRKERKLIGKVRQRVDNRLRGMGHDTLERVEDVAREAVRAAKKEAGRQGLTGNEQLSQS